MSNMKARASRVKDERNDLRNKHIQKNIHLHPLKLVPKIVYGQDSKGYFFIYFKLKNFTTEKYLDDFFILLYQAEDVDGLVEKRMSEIVNIMIKKFDCSDVRESPIYGKRKQFIQNKYYFFIKRKLFREVTKMINFYKRTVQEIAQEFSWKELSDNVKNQDFMATGVLNLPKKK